MRAMHWSVLPGSSESAIILEPTVDERTKTHLISHDTAEHLVDHKAGGAAVQELNPMSVTLRV